MPKKQKQPQNVVFGRRAKVACEQASVSEAMRTKRNRVSEATVHRQSWEQE